MKAGSLFLFWDYDTQWGADRSRGPSGAKNWGPLEFVYTDELLDLHAKYGVPACFAVVGAVAVRGERPYHDPHQIRRIHKAGHEVASHSFQHDWLPGLGRVKLRETLRLSKESLEDCIGDPVEAFVPPYNQPFDYPPGLSFSLSERREAGSNRVGLKDVCEALSETGYRFCRVGYWPMHFRICERILGRPLRTGALVESIAGVRCLRMNTRGGFDERVVAALEYCVASRTMMTVYGHPHSLHSGNSQDFRHVKPFLEKVRGYVQKGLLRVCTPRDIFLES